jgi:hypothetical protein
MLENFEWGSDGDSVATSGGTVTWTVTAAGTSRAEIDTAQYYSPTRCMRLYRDGTNNTLAIIPLSPITVDTVLSMRIRKDTNSRLEIGHGDGTHTFFVRFNTDEAIQYYDGSYQNTGISISANTWYLLEIKHVDWAALSFDIYIDGSLVKAVKTMPATAAYGNKLECSNGAGTSESWVDDIQTTTITDFPTSNSLEAHMAFVSSPLATTPVWVNIASDVREIHSVRGRDHDLDRMESGTLDIVLDNTSGDYWPDNTGGTYTPNVTVMKKIYIRAFYDGIYDTFTGYVESYTPSYLSGGGYGSLMTLHCVGALGKIIALQSLNNAGYASQQSGTRVGAVLTECGIPAGWQSLDAGQDLFQATGALVNENALNHLQQCQESELSLLYEDTDGDLLYEDRSHRTASPHTVSQATFGDDAGEIGYTDFSYVLDEVLLFNDVRVTRTGGTEQTETNSTSITNYGTRTFVRTTLHNADTQAGHLALYVIARYSDVAGRVDSIELTPDSSTKWTQCLARKISDRVTVRNNDAGIDKDYFIEGITQDWDFVNGTYVTRFQLSDADLYLNPPDAQTEILRPNAAGDANVLNTNAGAGSANNYTYVDEATPDEDTTYVKTEFPTVGTDLYNLPSLSYASATITSVVITCRMRRIDAVSGNGYTVIKTNGSTYNGTKFVLDTNWTNYSTTYLTNPNTSAAWTVSEVNALQAGVYLNCTNTHEARCTQVYVTVNFVPGW